MFSWTKTTSYQHNLFVSSSKTSPPPLPCAGIVRKQGEPRESSSILESFYMQEGGQLTCFWHLMQSCEDHDNLILLHLNNAANDTAHYLIEGGNVMSKKRQNQITTADLQHQITIEILMWNGIN